MPESWAVDMVEALRGQGGSMEEDGLMFAKVNTERPITLRLHGQVVSKFLYINASLSLRAGDEVLVLKSGVTIYILLKVVPV